MCQTTAKCSNVNSRLQHNDCFCRRQTVGMKTHPAQEQLGGKRLFQLATYDSWAWCSFRSGGFLKTQRTPYPGSATDIQLEMQGISSARRTGRQCINNFGREGHPLSLSLSLSMLMHCHIMLTQQLPPSSLVEQVPGGALYQHMKGTGQATGIFFSRSCKQNIA